MILGNLAENNYVQENLISISNTINKNIYLFVIPMIFVPDNTSYQVDKWWYVIQLIQ